MNPDQPILTCSNGVVDLAMKRWRSQRQSRPAKKCWEVTASPASLIYFFTQKITKTDHVGCGKKERGNEKERGYDREKNA